MSEPVDPALLQAKQSITEVLYRYCRGLGRMDRAMALSVWTPNAVVDYGETFQGNMKLMGAQSLADLDRNNLRYR